MTLWLYTNIHEPSALQRYIHVLHLDEGHVHEDFAQYGYSNLKKYYHHKGEDANSARAFRKMIEFRGYPWDIAGFVNFVNAMEDSKIIRDDIDAVCGLILQKSSDSLLMSVRQGAGRQDSSEYVIDQLFFMKPEISASVFTVGRIQTFIGAYPDLPQCRLLIYALEPPGDRDALNRYIAVYGESRAMPRGGRPLLSTQFRSGITHVIGQMYRQLDQPDSARIWYARSYSLDSMRSSFLDDYGMLISRDGEYDRAALLFRKAISADSTYAESYLHLAAYHIQVNRDEETATRLLDKYLIHSLDPVAKSKVQALLDRMGEPRNIK
jgi:tetratricopeptide (TPR) repeat protein